MLNLTLLFFVILSKVCKQIWLGLFDDRSSAIPDFRDPQKSEEFLQEKYRERKDGEWIVSI